MLTEASVHACRSRGKPQHNSSSQCSFNLIHRSEGDERKEKQEGLRIDRVERSLKIEGMLKHQTELWVWYFKSMVGL
jgi:hypothetical protein